MKRLTDEQWERFYRLRRLYPELTQPVLAERFGISLRTARIHWHRHLASSSPSSAPCAPPSLDLPSQRS